MNDHLSRGFVVPVWVRNSGFWPNDWHPAWRKPGTPFWRDGRDGEYLKDPHVYGNDDGFSHPDEFRPRDPNRAGGSDRPDLHPEPEG